MKVHLFTVTALLAALAAPVAAGPHAAAGSQAALQDRVMRKHLSSSTGDLSLPNHGTEQTSITIGDFGHDGHPGFVLTERTAPDSVVLYRRIGSEWKRFVIEPEPLHIEGGDISRQPGSRRVDFHEAKAVDLDGDGRPDIVSKPYNYGSPRIDVFMNQGVKGARR